MVKISFQPITGQKAEKDDSDGDKTQIFIQHPPNLPHVEEELVLPVGRKRSSLSGLCCLTTALIVFTCSLIYASIYIYRYYIIPQGLTAYHDIALNKCYVTELNTTVVMPPRNLWELLINVKKGTYLPQTYIVQEEMVVTGRVNNMHQLGRFIYRLCNGKDTYRLRRRTSRRRISKRDAQNCHRIRHFENTFVVETVICDNP
ncbi:integral membrane protein 2Ca isoform X1 [Paramisgurnus dabryanus]|uniref:integral membrane protein 2Ca isoform X1 n=1 Tax=Paramisgurnus dabryanus TaxID=90735 RepID=UPI0031F41EA1